MSRHILKAKDYYALLLAPRGRNGRIPTRKEVAVEGCTENVLNTWMREGRPPSPAVHSAWCARFPDKPLHDHYTRIWGSDDPDEVFEQTAVYNSVTADLLKADCEHVRLDPSASMLDRRFALEQLTTLAEVRRDWGEALVLVTEMLGVQEHLNDPIYLGRALVRKAYITYKHSRTATNVEALLADAKNVLKQAEDTWKGLLGPSWIEKHPDIKAYIKWNEVSALIHSRREDHDGAIELIKEAQRLRESFSGAAGQASGSYREGVVYSLAEKSDSNAKKARNAFKRCLATREDLRLWQDVGNAAARWAQFELAQLEAGRGSPDLLLEVTTKAFHGFSSSKDYVRAAEIALDMVEHASPSFWEEGRDSLLRVIAATLDEGQRSSGFAQFQKLLHRPGWRRWLTECEAARVCVHAIVQQMKPAKREAEARNTRREMIYSAFAPLVMPTEALE